MLSVRSRGVTDRTRTGGLSPDKRALCSTELRPRAFESSAGGIRTHDLELMRLARTASPLPRRSGRQESNLRSPVPETGGVATLPYSQTEESWEEGLASLNRGGALRTPSGAIRCPSARLPATVMDRQGDALSP